MDTAAVEVLINKLENAAFHHGTEYRVHGSDNYSAEWREARTKLDSAIEAIQQNAYAEGRKDEREAQLTADPGPCEHLWKVTHQGVTYCDCKCAKCGETKRETWD